MITIEVVYENDDFSQTRHLVVDDIDLKSTLAKIESTTAYRSHAIVEDEYTATGDYLIHDFSVAMVKAETSKRITAYLSANTRDNAVAGLIIAMASDPTFKLKESQFMRDFVLAGNAWIVEMRATCQTLIKDRTPFFKQDDRWPKVPAILADNYKKF